MIPQLLLLEGDGYNDKSLGVVWTTIAAGVAKVGGSIFKGVSRSVKRKRAKQKAKKTEAARIQAIKTQQEETARQEQQKKAATRNYLMIAGAAGAAALLFLKKRN